MSGNLVFVILSRSVRTREKFVKCHSWQMKDLVYDVHFTFSFQYYIAPIILVRMALPALPEVVTLTHALAPMDGWVKTVIRDRVCQKLKDESFF